jgi:molecular chaperone GrpE
MKGEENQTNAQESPEKGVFCGCKGDEALVAEIGRLKAELEAERGKVREYTGLLQGLQADFENHLKRSEAERREYSRSACQDLVLKLLDIVDTMDLALAAKPDGGSERLLDGFRRVSAQLKSVLSAEGVAEIPAEGVFNHDVHEAVEAVPDSSKPDGTIVEVVQRGYMLNGKVIRTSKVVVAKNRGE